MRDALATHCVICGQWCARVKQHHRLMHASAWTMHEQAISQCCSAGLRALSSCQYCGRPALQPSRHLKHCTVLYQASLASLLLTQASQDGCGPGGEGEGSAGPGRDAASPGLAASQPEHDAGAKRWGAGGGGRCQHEGSATQVAETSLQGRQRRLTGWLAPKRMGPEAPVGEEHPGEPGASAGVGSCHSGCHEEHGESRAPARSGDPATEDGRRLHGLHRYFRPGHIAPSLLHGRELVREVRPGHSQDAAEARSLPLHAGDPEDEGRRNHARRGPPAKVHECGVDCGRFHSAQPGLGLPQLGFGAEVSGPGRDCSTCSLGGYENDRPAASALSARGCPQELQDPAQDVAEGSVQGGGSSLHDLHRPSGRVQQDLLRCPACPERITKLIGVRIRPERVQESQLIKQLKESYMGTTYCDWGAPENPWKSSAA